MSQPKIEIIYEDSGLLIINKSAGISVTKDRSGGDEILKILQNQLKKALSEPLRLIHRLDKDTSGVMAIAKTIEIQREFTTFFENGLIKKTYLALVSGIPETDEGAIEKPLAQSQKDNKLICIDLRGKKAVTNWRLLADFGPFSLLEVNPLTGRTHQIRVHLASIGLPLAIDPLYGSNAPILLSEFKNRYKFAKNSDEKPLIDRLTLHCYQLKLPAECEKRYPAIFTASLDKKFAATLKMLTKHGSRGSEAFREESNLQNILSGRDLC